MINLISRSFRFVKRGSDHVTKSNCRTIGSSHHNNAGNFWAIGKQPEENKQTKKKIARFGLVAKKMVTKDSINKVLLSRIFLSNGLCLSTPCAFFLLLHLFVFFLNMQTYLDSLALWEGMGWYTFSMQSTHFGSKGDVQHKMQRLVSPIFGIGREIMLWWFYKFLLRLFWILLWIIIIITIFSSWWVIVEWLYKFVFFVG